GAGAAQQGRGIGVGAVRPAEGVQRGEGGPVGLDLEDRSLVRRAPAAGRAVEVSRRVADEPAVGTRALGVRETAKDREPGSIRPDLEESTQTVSAAVVCHAIEVAR